jgi:hypothetical protein
MGVAGEDRVGRDAGGIEGFIQIFEHLPAAGVTASAAEGGVVDGEQERPPLPIVAGILDLRELFAEKVPLVVPDDTALDHPLVLPTVGKEGQNLDERGVQSEIHSRLVHGSASLVVWVPLAEPPDWLTKTSLSVSAFCQYFGATSMIT